MADLAASIVVMPLVERSGPSGQFLIFYTIAGERERSKPSGNMASTTTDLETTGGGGESSRQF